MTIAYRALSPNEAGLFGMIDRAELIDGAYTMEHGDLVLHEFRKQVAGWYESELVDHPARLRETLASGGGAYGAWFGETLVGIVGLRVQPVGGDPRVMQLEPLHVSAPWRNQGIGTRLTALVAAHAKSLGATALYISATPTRNTVDAYRKMGAKVLANPDPTLFALEPEDIHLLLPIEDQQG